jgi:hypothetical protein
LDKTVDIVLALEAAGADVIELGLPFSDPLADGIVNQMAAERALKSGMSTARALDFLRFAGQPEVQAGLPPRIPYGVTARGVDERLPREVLPLLPTTPANAAGALRIDDRFWVENIDRLGRRFESWLGG